MTANVNILRGDLHLLVSGALNRGRYVLMTGGGDGSPIEITLDLRERPDDLFGEDVSADQFWTMTPDQARALAGKHAAPPSDDHGASVPAQDHHYSSPNFSIEARADGPYAVPTGPRVYEFALQDTGEADLDMVSSFNAPDQEAVSEADWVHVYDRVTRERRTLKRPEADAVLTGLQDVAADLRGLRQPLDAAGEKFRALHETQPVRGDPVEPPFGCAALPPVGPLTSTERLRAGDVLFHADPDFGPVRHDGYVNSRTIGVQSIAVAGRGLSADFSEFRFVGRPDADGWITWAGGENPVPGAYVEIRCDDDSTGKGASERWMWDSHMAPIVAFRIVDTPPAV